MATKMKMVKKDGKMEMGGAKKPKMMKGGAAKPKAMYGTSMKPGMMQKGGVKKYDTGGPTDRSNSAATMATPSSTTPPTGSNKLYGSGIAKKMKTGGTKKK